MSDWFSITAKSTPVITGTQDVFLLKKGAPNPPAVPSTTTTTTSTSTTSTSTTTPTTSTTSTSTTTTLTSTTTPVCSDSPISTTTLIVSGNNLNWVQGPTIYPGDWVEVFASGCIIWDSSRTALPEGSYNETSCTQTASSVLLETFPNPPYSGVLVYPATNCYPLSLVMAVRPTTYLNPGYLIADGLQPNRYKLFSPAELGVTSESNTWFIFNDALGYETDNTGYFQVTVKVYRPCFHLTGPTHTTSTTTTTTSTTTTSTTTTTTTTSTTTTTTGTTNTAPTVTDTSTPPGGGE
jgi:hypothetical protein